MAERKVIFPKVNGFVHGGDYNPDQWLDRPDILEKDISLMKKAGVNCVTLGVFAWAEYEPREGEFHIEWLKEIMDNLYANGIYTVLATPTGARPVWLDQKYPEAMRVDAYGVRYKHGLRHNHCMSSPVFREKVKIIDSLLAENFANHPGLVMWHISNELGGECFCDKCRARFIDFLKDRYHNNIDELNKQWWTSFWSHKFTEFEQIDPPYSNGESCVMGLNLDWKRFTTYNMNDYMKWEIDILRKYNPNIPVTTNFMEVYWGLDYHKMMDNLDVISWDSYPAFHNDYESLHETFMKCAFNHALFRSMKPDKPFMMMESAPGVVNWHHTNKYRRPGMHKLACLQAIASGSDTVQYFQWRKSRGSSEQFHGAVVDHMGTDDTRVFKAVANVGQKLVDIKEVAGSVMDNKVAVLFDWDNRWAIDDAWTLDKDTKKYEVTTFGIWKELCRLGNEPDIISSDMDFDRYKVIVAPMLYLLHDGVGEKIKKFIENGGQFMATYFSGYVNENCLAYLEGFPGQDLKNVFGIISEEMDTFFPSDRNSIWVESLNKSLEVRDYQELLRVADAKVLASYEGDYVKGTAAVTVNDYGKGKAYYVACRLKPEDMDFVFEEMLTNAGIEVKALPDNVERHVRTADGINYEFYHNYGDKPVTIGGVEGKELLQSKDVKGNLIVEPMDVAVVKRS